MNNLIHIRQQIDAIDHSILQLLAKRLELATQTRAFKSIVKDENREREVQRRWKEEAEALGLSPAFTDQIFQLVLKESHRLQSRIV
jgi:chorismate mutase / prephenate dehydrogenase